MSLENKIEQKDDLPSWFPKSKDNTEIENEIKRQLLIKFQNKNDELLRGDSAKYRKEATREVRRTFNTLQSKDEQYRKIKEDPVKYCQMKTNKPEIYESLREASTRYQEMIQSAIITQKVFCDAITATDNPNDPNYPLENYLEINEDPYEEYKKTMMERAIAWITHSFKKEKK